MTLPLHGNKPVLNLLSEAEFLRAVLAEDYEILEELGRGGMASVLRAREKALDREVAIKVLPARLVVDQGFVDRFEHEARIAAKLEHPNIVPIYRVGRAGPNGEVIYFVMKLLRGQSLSAVLRERIKLDPADVRRILMETGSALNYAAKLGVVHRDIKPDNILLDSEGRCVITDFGIAKAPGGHQTTAGMSLGTPRYMSPEHATGQKLDGRSDIYSLGVVAYQCLFGRAPFEAEDPFAVLYKHIHEPVPEPSLTNDDERQLYSVVARMLAKKPAERYQTGNDLIAALGGQASDPSLIAAMITEPGLMAPTEVIPTQPPWHRARWYTRSRSARLAIAGAMTIAAALVVTSLVDVSDGSSEPVAPPVTMLPTSATLSAGTVVDSAKEPPVPQKPVPSARVAAIVKYNAYKSGCATRDTVAGAAPIEYAVLLDSIADRPRSETMKVGYDVCGLAAGAPFEAVFTLTKLNQRNPLSRQAPLSERAIESAGSPRSRKTFSLDMTRMSPGDYSLDVIIEDRRDSVRTASRRFRINKD